MKKINCNGCGKLLAELAAGSRVSKGLIAKCTVCTGKTRKESKAEVWEGFQAAFGKGFNNG